MNAISFEVFRWNNWLFGFAYGLIVLTACFIDADSLVGILAIGVSATMAGFAVWLTIVSIRKRRANKLWLDKFNKEHGTHLDQEVLNKLVEKVCETHKEKSPAELFRIAARALAHKSDNLTVRTPCEESVLRAYEKPKQD